MVRDGESHDEYQFLYRILENNSYLVKMALYSVAEKVICCPKKVP